MPPPLRVPGSPSLPAAFSYRRHFLLPYIVSRSAPGVLLPLSVSSLPFSLLLRMVHPQPFLPETDDVWSRRPDMASLLLSPLLKSLPAHGKMPHKHAHTLLRLLLPS